MLNTSNFEKIPARKNLYIGFSMAFFQKKCAQYREKELSAKKLPE